MTSVALDSSPSRPTRTASSVDAPPDAWERPVPRRLVHRRAVAEVFPTAIWRTGDQQFAVAVQWPRAHPFYTPRRRRYDSVLLLETIRQVGLLVVHEGWGLPTSTRFLVDHLTFDATGEGLAVDTEPADLLVSVVCRDVRRRKGVAAGMRLDVEIRRGDVRVAIGAAHFDSVSEATYRRLRGDRAEATATAPVPLPVRPWRVARDRVTDVVIAPRHDDGSWLLRIDVQHPTLFDHAVDHVPAMLLTEAMRQAAHDLIGPDADVVSVDGTFQKFVELNRPVRLLLTSRHEAHRLVRLHFAVEQDGSTCAHGVLSLA